MEIGHSPDAYSVCSSSSECNSCGGCGSGPMYASAVHDVCSPHASLAPQFDPTATFEHRRSSIYNQQLPGNKKAGDAEQKHGHVFVDPDAMKDRVRKNLARPKYDVKDFYREEGIWQAIARSHGFEVVTLIVITVNAIWIAVDTDLNEAAILVNSQASFQVIEHLFCIYFSFEWIIRFLSFQLKCNCFRDAWFLFDSVLVLAMVGETWVMTVVILLTGSNGAGGGNASVLRVARLLRLSRMARMVRVLRAMPELMIMIKGMVAASRSVLFTLLLLILLMYVFAVAMTQLLQGTNVGDRYFHSVPRSMYTLWIYGVLLDDVGTMSNRLLQENFIFVGVYFLYILLAALTVMNMLIGVLCEVVSATAITEKEELLVTYVNEKLRSVVGLIDQDGSMSISKTEFKQILENVEAARCLQDVGVDVVGLVDYADAIFTDDNGDEEAELSFPKFMEVILNLRGTNHATVKDIVDLRKFIRKVMPRRGSTESASTPHLRTSIRDTVRDELRAQLSSMTSHWSMHTLSDPEPLGRGHAPVSKDLDMIQKAYSTGSTKSFMKMMMDERQDGNAIGGNNGNNKLLQALPVDMGGQLSAGTWLPMRYPLPNGHSQPCLSPGSSPRAETPNGSPKAQWTYERGNSPMAPRSPLGRQSVRKYHRPNPRFMPLPGKDQEDSLGLPGVACEREEIASSEQRQYDLAASSSISKRRRGKHIDRIRGVLQQVLKDLEGMHADAMAKPHPAADDRKDQQEVGLDSVVLDAMQVSAPSMVPFSSCCCQAARAAASGAPAATGTKS